MNKHHLILGTLKDFLTNDILDDTHDERYRQKLSRLLVENKGYQKEEILSGHKLVVRAENKKAIIKVDFLITMGHNISMIIKYSPGSIVSRRRSSLAMSRVVSSYQIPVVVVTNGEDAEIMDGTTGTIFERGLVSIPIKSDLIKLVAEHSVKPISEKQAEMESRIIYAFEIDGSCPCDESIRQLGPHYAK